MVTTESFMIRKLFSCLVKLLHAANERNTPGDLFAVECFDYYQQIASAWY